MDETKKEEILEEELVPEVLDAAETPDSEKKLAELTDKNLRLTAEFDNYRKRTTKEMVARYDDGVRHACEKLLPLIDNFERAINAQENKEDSFYQGVVMIARQMGDILSDLGISQMEVNPGDEFDPNLHNAVAHAEDENFGANQISQVLQKGYKHKDKVIRYAMVKVAN